MTGRTIGAGREVLPWDADRDEWLAARLPLITASEIGIVLGISPFGSPFNLHWVKRGAIGDDFDSERLSLGRHMESWIADRFAEMFPEYGVERAGLVVSPDRPWQGATPDRVLYDAQCYCATPDNCQCDVDDLAAALEIKTSGTYEEWGPDGSDEIPPYIRAQLLWQLDVLGLGHGFVACLFLATQKIRIYRIEQDEDDLELMRERAWEFLANVAAGRVPDIDHTAATTQALGRLHPLETDDDAEIEERLAEDYLHARLALTDAEQHYDLITNQVRGAMGGAKYAVAAGAKVAVRSVYDQSGCDMDRLKARHPEAYADCRTTKRVDKISPSRAKREWS